MEHVYIYMNVCLWIYIYSSIESCQALISSNKIVMTVSDVIFLDMYWLSFSDWT